MHGDDAQHRGRRPRTTTTPNTAGGDHARRQRPTPRAPTTHDDDAQHRGRRPRTATTPNTAGATTYDGHRPNTAGTTTHDDDDAQHRGGDDARRPPANSAGRAAATPHDGDGIEQAGHGDGSDKGDEDATQGDDARSRTAAAMRTVAGRGVGGAGGDVAAWRRWRRWQWDGVTPRRRAGRGRRGGGTPTTASLARLSRDRGRNRHRTHPEHGRSGPTHLRL